MTLTKKRKDYRTWHVPVSKDDITLEEAFQGLKSHLEGYKSKSPFLIWLFENPKSPLAMDGAIGLDEHDYVHCLLGRGLCLKDEAFVVGFTMGSTRDLSHFEKFIFNILCDYVYPKYYNFSREEVEVFEMAVIAGHHMSITPLHNIHFDKIKNRKLKDVREDLGIDTDILQHFYSIEKKLYPDSMDSQRLLD